VASSKVVDQSSLESNFDGTVKVRQRNVVEDSQGRHMVMGRNTAIVVVDDDGNELAVHRLPYGTHLRVDDGTKVKRGDRLAEWDPYTRPVLTEIEGTIEFEDLVEGVSVSEQRDESTGITNSVIIDWRASPRGADLRPAMAIKDKKGNIGKLSRGGEARYLLPVDAVLSVEPGYEVKAGDVLARIPMESAKTRDITGGLPRVAELFEARRPKDHAIIAEISGVVTLGRDYKNKRRITITPEEEGKEPVEFLIPKGRHLTVQEGDRIEKGEYLLDGHPAPHDILAIKGVEELANYLVNEIQEVYRLQGVTINDKHIEVIVRQMLQKIEVGEPGDTEFLKGEQVDRIDFEDANIAAEAAGGKRAEGQHVLLGITKASLQTRSFISAASFQETTRVLTDAAVNGKSDALEGLKENVIVGRLVPAGTGSMLSRLNRIASHRDDLILEERERAAQEAIVQGEEEAAEGTEEAEEGAST
jgi:DNA-directed RNA polymerase subunit beta'